MRLLNASTGEIEEFLGSPSSNVVPPYAILSHRWGRDEVTFQEYNAGTAKAGLYKIQQTLRRALNQGLNYAWVDTCCIDKTNSAELSEAINSMFNWYEKAAICFAYLDDVDPDHRQTGDPPFGFTSSLWFGRGWTLQELLAPSEVQFLASDWSFINTRRT
ncbi:hypothetical protein PG995_013145 [Apiospora arundinis]